MSYRLIYTEAFRNDIADHVDYLQGQHAPGDIIERWYDRLFDRLDNLTTWPRSYPVDERATKEQGRQIRKLVYAHYVITYHVDDDQQRVLMLAMVHGARRK